MHHRISAQMFTYDQSQDRCHQAKRLHVSRSFSAHTSSSINEIITISSLKSFLSSLNFWIRLQRLQSEEEKGLLHDGDVDQLLEGVSGDVAHGQVDQSPGRKRTRTSYPRGTGGGNAIRDFRRINAIVRKVPRTRSSQTAERVAPMRSDQSKVK